MSGPLKTIVGVQISFMVLCAFISVATYMVGCDHEFEAGVTHDRYPTAYDGRLMVVTYYCANQVRCGVTDGVDACVDFFMAIACVVGCTLPAEEFHDAQVDRCVADFPRVPCENVVADESSIPPSCEGIL